MVSLKEKVACFLLTMWKCYLQTLPKYPLPLLTQLVMRSLQWDYMISKLKNQHKLDLTKVIGLSYCNKMLQGGGEAVLVQKKGFSHQTMYRLKTRQ